MPCGKLHRAGITAAGTEAGRWFQSGKWFESGRLVRKPRPAPVPVGAEGDEGSERQFRDGPREAPRLWPPAVGRAGRAGGGLGRGPGLSGTGGSGHGARGRAQPSDRQTCIRQALRRLAGRPSIHPASRVPGGWKRRCRRLGLPRAPGRNLGAREGVGGVGVASAMLGTVTMAGKAVWHCRHTRFAPGLGSAWAVRAAAVSPSRGCGGAPLPESLGAPSPRGYRLWNSWQGLRS